MSKHTGEVQMTRDGNILVVLTDNPICNGSIDHDSFQSWVELSPELAEKIFKGLQRALYDTAPTTCPACGSDNLSTDNIDPEGLVAPVYCYQCGNAWEETYAFTGIT